MALLHGKDVCLFALSSNVPLAKEIAEILGVNLSELSLAKFSDGECKVSVGETVRGHDCFIVQSTCSPVNDNYMELFIMIDALKRASARSINVIMPYYGYSRQDRKTQAREPISAKLVADLITVAGATRVLGMDLHAAQIQGFFNIPIDNFEAVPVFVNYFKQNEKLNNVCIVSPDHGGLTRARKFSYYFDDSTLAIIDKRRPRPNVAEVMNVIGDVKGKTCIIVDDMIDTAGTAVAGVHALKELGAQKIYMCATHGILSGQAIERIQNSEIEKLIITNSVPLPKEKQIDKIQVISIARVFAQAILNILDNKPVSDLFTYNPHNF